MVTTLFAENRGFTPFAARVTPAEAVAALNDVFDRACAIVGNEHGIVDRVLGDGMLAIFGEPYPCEEHASAAARAAQVRTALAGPIRNPPRVGAALASSAFDVRDRGTIDLAGIGPTRVFELLR
jgi:class 3 adenylate cyclase